jgi:hypothetical protein
MDAFNDAIDLINRKLPPQIEWVSDKGGGLFGDDTGGRKKVNRRPAGEIVFQEKIGAIDIAIARVRRAEDFVKWIKRYLAKRKLPRAEIPAPLAEVIGQYIADGYTWFSLNIVSVGPEPRSKQAVRYSFDTDCVYYPMRITRTEHGHTEATLLVLTTRLFKPRQFAGLAPPRLKLEHRPVKLDADELRSLDNGLADLLGNPRRTYLRIWRIGGQLSEFDDDVRTGRPRRFYLRWHQRDLRLGPFDYCDGAKLNVLNMPLRVEADADFPGWNPRRWPDTFRLVHRGTTQPVGPFPYRHGAEVQVGRHRFTLEYDPRDLSADQRKALARQAELEGE